MNKLLLQFNPCGGKMGCNLIHASGFQKAYKNWLINFLCCLFLVGPGANQLFAQNCTGTRTVSNTTDCSNRAHAWTHNNDFAFVFWTTHGGDAYGPAVRYLHNEDLKWYEYGDGTAKLEGWLADNTSGEAYTLQVTFHGKTSSPPSGSPKENSCTNINSNGWNYYTSFSGTLKSAVSNFQLDFTRHGPAFQVGKGANIVNSNAHGLGGSGWFKTSDHHWDAGDININLGAFEPLNVECEANVNGVWSVLDDCKVTVCEGDNIYLSVNPGVSTVNWSGPNGFYAGKTNDLNLGTASQNKAGNYTATLTQHGCTSAKTIKLIVQDLNANINKSNNLSCSQTSATLTANPSGQSYKWDNGATSRTRTVSSAGTYKVTVTNSAGCKDVTSINVSGDTNQPTINLNKSNDLSCTQSSAFLSASTNGGQVTWNTGQSGTSIQVSSVGTYTATVTGANGCTASATITVSGDTNQPTINLNKSNDLSCTQSSAFLSASTNGGQVTWNTGQSGTSIQVNSAGTYTATVTGANGCTASATITVSGDTNQPTINLNKSNNISCNTTTATLTANASQGQVIWSTGQSGNSITVTTAGAYTATVTGANGCTASASIAVIGACAPIASVGNLVFNDANNNGTLDAGEQGISGVRVKLLRADGSQVATTTTDGSGNYNFGDLESGSYKVMFDVPNGFSPSPRTGFGDNDVDNNSDNNPNNGNMTDVFFLSPGESNPTIDVGFFAGTMCDNLNFGGKIGFGNTCSGTVEICGNAGAGPTVESCSLPSGGSGAIEYIWLKNEVSCAGPTGTVTQMLANPDAYNWKVLIGANSTTYNPDNLTTSTCFLRCARRAGCDIYLGESNIVRIEVNPNCGGNSSGTTTESCGNATSLTYGNGSIKMDGGSFYQIFDANWQTVYNCGWQCGSSKTATDLPAGEYRVYIKNSNYQVICEKVITLSGGTGGSGNTAGGDSGNTGGGSNTGSGSGNNITCGEVAITYGGGTIAIEGVAGQEYFFKVNDLHGGWAQVGGCGWNCGHQLSVSDLANSRYLITIFNSDWSQHCDVEIEMTDSPISGSAGSRNAAHLSFAAYQANREVELQWLTNSGYKVITFEVEHSTDGENFNQIEQFTNKEWSDEIAYHQTMDEQPTTGTNYYRVKEIYLDGSFAYTDIQKVGFEIDLNGISVFPNPAKHELFISLKPYANQAGVLTLTNQFGQLVKQIELETIKEDLIQLNTTQLLNGLYYLNVQFGGQKSFTKKVMIHRFY